MLVHSESFSNPPRSICLLVSPDFVSPFPGQPPLPPTEIYYSRQCFPSHMYFSLENYAKKRRLQVYFIEETYQEKNIIFEMGIKFCAF